MYEEDLLSPLFCRQCNLNLTIEAPRPKERFVEHLGAVCGTHDHHALIGLESVHLGEELIQCLFSLVVGPYATDCRSRLADSIDLVDEYNARGLLLRLFKQVAHARRAYTDEHLYKIRSA